MAAATYISSTSFSISGNVTSEFCVGRAVRCDCGTAGTFTGYITSSTYSTSTGKTTVVVHLDAGALTSQLSSASHGNDIPTSMCRATQASVGGVMLATSAISVAGTDATKPITPATQRQAVLSWVRDNLGKFPGITPPSLNLFCGDATSDSAPVGTFTRSTTGTRLGQAGLIESVAAGSPRREWDVAGNLLGWLFEGQSTNLILYNRAFSTASVWSIIGSSTITDTATTSPSGDGDAATLVWSATTNIHAILQYVDIASGSAHSFSIFLKNFGAPYVELSLDDGSSNGIMATFDLVNGTHLDPIVRGESTIPVAQMENWGNGWYRCSISGINGTSTRVRSAVVLRNDYAISWYPTSVGDATTGVKIWGAQLEQKAAPSSLIFTTSAASSRSADVWSVTINTSIYKQPEGSILSVFDSVAGPISGINNTVFGLHDGTLSNRIFLRSNNSTSGSHCLMVYGYESQVDIHLTPAAKNAMKKCAISYINNKTLFVENGGTIANDTLCTIPTITTINVGSGLSGADALNGHIKHLAYFPTALSDAQLQAITL